MHGLLIAWKVKFLSSCKQQKSVKHTSTESVEIQALEELPECLISPFPPVFIFTVLLESRIHPRQRF